MNVSETSQEGRRERKRRETITRITEAALGLFHRDGYEQTTVEAIATEVGISRRTFFNYFETKDEIVFSWQSSRSEVFFNDLLAQKAEQRPIDAVIAALPKLVTLFETEEFLAIDRLIHSNHALLARENAMFERQEHMLFVTLCRLWPAPERRAGLRLVAMVSSGALRLAFEQWRDDKAPSSFGQYLRKSFASLRAEL